tara:strand:- start:3885 stop:4709 length:825 start_codon:yes stop_codon:yes gene_type:complete
MLEGVVFMKVIYAHTDSLFCPVDSIEHAQDVCSVLNDGVREIFPNILGLEQHPVTLEFEKFYSSLGIGITKNRNAGFISWKDGKHLDEPEFVVTGFAVKKSTEIGIAKQVQERVLKMWANGNTEKEIVNYLKDIYQTIKNNKIDIDNFFKRSRLRKSINDYVTLAGGVAGTVYYNTHINPSDPITDSFITIKCNILSGPTTIPLNDGTSRAATYVSVKEKTELLSLLADGLVSVDNDYYANYCINKAEPIFKAMGWSMYGIYVDPKQKTLEDWF